MVEIGSRYKYEMQRFPRSIYIDSCAFHPPQEYEKPAMTTLWDLDRREIIQLEIAKATEEEMQKAPAKLREKANSRIFSLEFGGQTEEIRRLLFPNKKILNKGEINDIRNLSCAQYYNCDIFVTTDKKHILRKAKVIKQKLGMDVLLPTECLREVLGWLEWSKKHEEEMRRLRGEL